ncbi:MAG: histidine phosphatase family protein [Pseudomonadota bacterium]
MACELWLVRHGQAAFGTDNYDRLTALGWDQARWLGAHLAEQGATFDAICAGRLRRQQETARPIAEALGLTVETVLGFEEYDGDGLMQAAGRRAHQGDRADHFRTLRGLLVQWADGETPPGVETWQAFQDRIARAQATAIAADTAQPRRRVIAVSSGGAIAAAVAQALGLPPDQMVELNLQARNTGVTRLIFARRGVYLNQFNAVPHLDRPDRRHAETYS